METTEIARIKPHKKQFMPVTFEDAYYDSKLRYSLKHIIPCIGNVSRESTIEAIQKSLYICSITGIKIKHHFKQIYVFDTDVQTLCIDWLMSKTGFNLMLLQIPSLTKKKALWLWELAERQQWKLDN